MLSRRQFFSITVIMMVLLVMFQLTGVMKDYWNEYQTNEYAADEPDDMWQNAFESKSDAENVDGKYVVYIGDTENSAIGKMAKIWCQYTKKDFIGYSSLAEAEEKSISECSFLMLDSEYLDFDTDTDVLYDWAEAGKNMIFCNMPETEKLYENEALKQLLGIFSVYEKNVTVDGIDLYEGFLLGGRSIYEAVGEDKEQQDLELSMPWYATYANVKRYMIGLVPEDFYNGTKIKNEDMPSIIWRNNIGESRIFVVNGDYMSDVTALGICSAMEYEMNEYSLYPVVNSQNVSVLNFAGFSNEFDDKLNEEYSRDQQAVFQDLVWPSLHSVFVSSEDKPTYFMSPQLDYSDIYEADSDKLVYYMKLIGEAKAEAGLSSLQSSETEVEDKLKKDMAFYEELIPEYKFSSLYMSDMDFDNSDYTDYEKDVRTIGVEYSSDEAPVKYTEDGIVVQRITEDGFDYKYSDDLRLKSLQTALAYSNISVDLGCILYSDEAEDTWEHSSERLASNVVTYWKPYKAFDKTTITESDTKIRQFLNLDYSSNKEGNVVYLDIEQFDTEAAFIFRTHNESIESVKGAEFEKIEEHAYLIRALEKQVEIYLENDISLDIN